jgi:hypothetical protein
VSLLGFKTKMLAGGDTFAALRLKREAEQEALPICDKEWRSRIRLDDKYGSVTDEHKCSRIHGHRASHVCGCGATHQDNKGKGPRTRLGRAS